MGSNENVLRDGKLSEGIVFADPTDSVKAVARQALMHDFLNHETKVGAPCPGQTGAIDCAPPAALAASARGDQQDSPRVFFNHSAAKIPDFGTSLAPDKVVVKPLYPKGLSGTSVNASDLTLRPLAIGAFSGLVDCGLRRAFSARSAAFGVGVGVATLAWELGTYSWERYKNSGNGTA